MPAISMFVVSLQQTAPENSLICPGQQLVYSCTTLSTGVLQWKTIGQEYVAVLFTLYDSVNTIKVDGDQFTFQLIDVIMDGPMLNSIATAQMADSSIDGLQIVCNNGLSSSTLYVDVAGMYALIH